jgi:hypothetical protein
MTARRIVVSEAADEMELQPFGRAVIHFKARSQTRGVAMAVGARGKAIDLPMAQFDRLRIVGEKRRAGEGRSRQRQSHVQGQAGRKSEAESHAGAPAGILNAICPAKNL